VACRIGATPSGGQTEPALRVTSRETAGRDARLAQATSLGCTTPHTLRSLWSHAAYAE